MKPEKHSARRFISSFRHAWNGFRWFLSTEQNGRIHLIITALVIALGVYTQLTLMEWSLVILCIGLVISGELFNTALEKVCDFVSPEYHATIGKIKDMAAAAVLILSISAGLIGLAIFLPKLISFYQL